MGSSDRSSAPATPDIEAIREHGALFATWPRLARSIPWQRLGNWPSPLEPHRIEAVGGGAPMDVLIKREDLSADGYGGNKIRPLEVVFGAMRERGVRELWSTGAYGSNHALAAVIHARRLGLASGAILWPQPWSTTAQDNLAVTASLADRVVFVHSVAHMVPTALWVQRTRPSWVMPPGAATPLGALGHAGAALELAYQLMQLMEQGESIDAIVLPIGSTCTSVGLLVGTALAHAIGAMPRMPRIVAVRVTPWPVTDANRVAWMAARTARLLGERFVQAGLAAPGMPGALGGLRRAFGAFRARLQIIGDELGAGYGVPTPGGWRALAAFLHAGIRLDTTYSAKAAARAMKGRDGRIVFWSTKSSLALPTVETTALGGLPHQVRAWLGLGPHPDAGVPARTP